MSYDLLFSDGAGNKMNELAGTGYKALLPVCSDREGENPACTKGEKSMNRKFKNFLRRALTGLLSVSMIAGEFPVAALAAEPAAAVEEAAYEEEAAAVSEDEIVAEVSEDETEAPVVSEDEAEEAVAETEETEEAAAEDAEEAVKEADDSVEEAVEAEENEDGAIVPYLTYKLYFYLGEGKKGKAAWVLTSPA